MENSIAFYMLSLLINKCNAMLMTLFTSESANTCQILFSFWQSYSLILSPDMLAHECHGPALPSRNTDCFSILPKCYCLVKWQFGGCSIRSHCHYFGNCNPITLGRSCSCHTLMFHHSSYLEPWYAPCFICSYSRTQLRLRGLVDWLDFVAVILFL
jgi:hypothetical protein